MSTKLPLSNSTFFTAKFSSSTVTTMRCLSLGQRLGNQRLWRL